MGVHAIHEVVSMSARRLLGGWTMQNAAAPPDRRVPHLPAIRRVSPDEALAMWTELLRGAWTIVDGFDDPGGRRLVLACLDGREHVRPWHRLSARERTIVALVAVAHTNRRIASELGVSVSTVAGHLRMARRKLGGVRRIDIVREWSTASGGREDGRSHGTDPGATAPPGLEVFRIETHGVTLGLWTFAVSGAASPPRLTEAERAVGRAVLQGKTNSEIAAERGTALRTVANQVARLFAKMRVGSRTELAIRCLVHQGGNPAGGIRRHPLRASLPTASRSPAARGS